MIWTGIGQSFQKKNKKKSVMDINCKKSDLSITRKKWNIFILPILTHLYGHLLLNCHENNVTMQRFLRKISF